MGIYLRISLLIMCAWTFFYIGRRIRKSQMQVEDSLFWIGFSGILVILSIFPRIAFWAADILQIQSPSNFIFLLVMFLLLMKAFSLSVKVSQLEHKLQELTQKVAIEKREMELKDEKRN